LWRLTGDPDATAIDAASISDPVCRELLARFDDARLAVLLHDATSDVGITTVHCTVFEPGSDPSQIVFTSTGMGCHPARAVALSRAVTEAAQSRLTLISGARDDVFRPKYEPPVDAAVQTERLSAQWLVSDRGGRSFAELPDVATTTLQGDLDVVIDALSARGLHACWVDLGRPDVGVSVGRAIVAGLEHLSDLSGYRPGARAQAALTGVAR
jgi:ribosomal protein S12 methylthiotransferase accessory factor